MSPAEHSAGLSLRGSFLFCVEVKRKENEEGTEADHRDIQGGADIPAEILCDPAEDDQRGIGRAHEEHIDLAVGRLPAQQVDAERNAAEDNEGDRCGLVIGHGLAGTVGKGQIKACSVSVQYS